jgi:adenine-specific DNA-methyltransferase
MPRTSAKPKTRSRKVNRASATPTAKKKPIEQYDHKGKERVNNPPVGLVRADTGQESMKKTYAYDPHHDPQLIWAEVISSSTAC